MPKVTFVDIIAKTDTVDEIAAYLDYDTGVTYVVRHEYPRGASDADVKEALAAKIAAFVPPAPEVPKATPRPALISELLDV